MQRGVSRRARHRLRIGIIGAGDVPHHQLGAGDVAMHRRLRGVDRQRLLELGDGVLVTAERLQRIAEIMVGFRISRFQRGRRFIAPDRIR